MNLSDNIPKSLCDLELNIFLNTESTSNKRSADKLIVTNI